MEACLIVTYRCNAKCYMCHTWMNPSKKEEEFSPNLVEKIPNKLKFINITGGEPFIRNDLEEIIRIALGKTKRLVISTNGYYTERIIRLAERYHNQIGFRISIEGLSAANDQLRGIKDGFDRGLRSLLALHDMGIKDIGFGITVSDRNANDIIDLFRLAEAMNVEFATAITHNSYYFHKHDNTFEDPEMVANNIEVLARELLRSKRVKSWFRAYFNIGLANKVRGGNRLLPCEVGTDVFFMDPYGNIMPCNGSDQPLIMGNLKEYAFHEIWNSEKANQIRKEVTNCQKQCWMIGSVAPVMKKRFWVPAKWILTNKFKKIAKRGKDFSVETRQQNNSRMR